MFILSVTSLVFVFWNALEPANNILAEIEFPKLCDP